MSAKIYEELENKIGYSFSDKSRLDIAFTHKSYTNEKTCVNFQSYERYEFLGDAILEFLTSEYLFKNYSHKTEGELTKLRASLVCEFTLSKIARDLNLGSYCLFSKGEKITGGANRDSILCDLFESLLGAMYLDGGIEPARKFVETHLLTDIEHKQLFYDAKTTLQEYAQKREKKISYVILEEKGPDHNKEYIIQVMMDDEKGACGAGHNKKSAEQMAAFNTLKALQN